MPVRPLQATNHCPNCGANIAGLEDHCPACGAPLKPDETTLRVRREALRQLVETSNQNLAATGTNAAESAFGIGCSLGVLASGILLLLTFLLGGRDWTLLAIVAVAASLVSTGVSALLATRAKSATLDATYERSIRPEIESFVRSHRLTHQEFDRMAREILADGTPLRSYLAPPPQEEPDSTMPEE